MKDSSKVQSDIEFENRNSYFIKKMNKNKNFKKISKIWLRNAFAYEYSYHFRWLGRPVIQFPTDLIALQEIIWETKPDLIIETGIARGGSLIFYASLLQLIGKGKVLGIDLDIRKHNRIQIEKHFLSKRIKMLEGSSTDDKIIQDVYQYAKGRKNIMVLLDSNHSESHVKKELELYSPLVRRGNYLVVFDTLIEYLPKNLLGNRPWGKGNNPKTAVEKFLKSNTRFIVDRQIDDKLMITSNIRSFLKCVK